MALVRLRNINPLGQVDLPLARRQGDPIGEEGSGCLEPGEVFEIDAKHAGRAPSTVVDEETGADTYDPGEGLLAQVGNYELLTDEEIAQLEADAEAQAAAQADAAKAGTSSGGLIGGSAVAQPPLHPGEQTFTRDEVEQIALPHVDAIKQQTRKGK